MLFNSLAFAVFLPIVFILYWAIPQKYRWILLLTASYYFYMSWNVKYVVLILLTTIVSYFTARIIELTEEVKYKKMTVALAAVICFGVLYFFKYYNFSVESVNSICAKLSIPLTLTTMKLLLPVGISFYTFQTFSYVIDVYRGDIAAEKHFGYYATFISFFPQLVAGPIERTRNLLPQIKKASVFKYEQATQGLKLMAWGYYKKIVIADMLSLYVGKIFDAPREFSGFCLVMAAVMFSFQIYCDFSGYSDIAIGTAKLLGIDLMTNFKSPYFSKSIKEFWSRWHISLSTWFRDYVYIPMGGSRVGKMRHMFNLLVTFLVSGLWHGANWTFVVWGGLHGVGQIIENALVPKKTKKISEANNKKNKAISCLKVLIVFAFTTIAWVFFAAKSLSDVAYILAHMFSGISSPVSYMKYGFVDIGMSKGKLLLASLLIFILALYDYIALSEEPFEIIAKKNVVFRWAIYVGIGALIVFFSQKGVPAEFVYFQF